MASAFRVIIGVDFGTTFSGVAYVCVHPILNIFMDTSDCVNGMIQADSATHTTDIQVIREWPGVCIVQSFTLLTIPVANLNTNGIIIPIYLIQSALNFEKVPSEIVYNKDGTFKWGYEAASVNDGSIIRFVKLLLDPEQTAKAMSSTDPLGLDAIRRLIPQNKTPVDIVVDYLIKLKEHCLPIMAGKYGRNWWINIPVEYHLTVPAVSGVILASSPHSKLIEASTL